MDEVGSVWWDKYWVYELLRHHCLCAFYACLKLSSIAKLCLIKHSCLVVSPTRSITSWLPPYLYTGAEDNLVVQQPVWPHTGITMSLSPPLSTVPFHMRTLTFRWFQVFGSHFLSCLYGMPIDYVEDSITPHCHLMKKHFIQKISSLLLIIDRAVVGFL